MSPLYLLLYFAMAMSGVMLVFLAGALIITVFHKVHDRIFFPRPEARGEEEQTSTNKVARIRVAIEKKRVELSELHDELEEEESKKGPYKRNA